MKTIDFSYFIERFIANEMDETEKKWFSRELEDNEGLRNEVELRRKTDVALRNQNILNLRTKLAELEKQNTAPVGSRVVKSRKSVYKYAAVLTVLIISAGSFMLLHNNNLKNLDIIEKYYRPYEAPSVARSVSPSVFSDYNTAVEYYKIGDFKQAAVYFSKALEQEPENMGSVLLNGISNYEIKNYPEAEGSFKKVIVDDNSYFIDHAQWYLGLCYIQTGELKQAKEQFLIISKSNTVYSKRAKKIFKTLNQKG